MFKHFDEYIRINEEEKLKQELKLDVNYLINI